MKGIILAGGRATRLFPITRGTCKQLLPVYDKPMIYYPLSVLMLAGIREILIISTPQDIGNFKSLFGDGSSMGLTIEYAEQAKPRGLAEAFIIGEDFIKNQRVCMILGDNIFYGDQLGMYLKRTVKSRRGGSVFAYNVSEPQRYGVVEFNRDKEPVRVVEKPKKPKSNWAVTGIYFFDKNAAAVAKKVKPSPRGELEITDVINAYMRKGDCHVEFLGRGMAWLDTGTYDSLMDAGMFIKIIEERQGLKIGCVEEIAYREGFINKRQLLKLADEFKTSYGQYLKRIVAHEG
ncbi:MAG: glucose-1-phosphate thymidylyltransferase RfbA [Candidatus Omnitrophica bacterium]|nr:glucose-1-phosphate thymidylyltransferase RfbA [Candidatus Omnitrophota bacterium]MCB9721754.1 glucose-1-phosphate thymidylyltransferase RfbA [Candidatus Omnitrophota bacterium]